MREREGEAWAAIIKWSVRLLVTGLFWKLPLGWTHTHTHDYWILPAPCEIGYHRHRPPLTLEKEAIFLDHQVQLTKRPKFGNWCKFHPDHHHEMDAQSIGKRRCCCPQLYAHLIRIPYKVVLASLALQSIYVLKWTSCPMGWSSRCMIFIFI